MIIEGLVTTLNADRTVNLAPMGPRVEPPMDRLLHFFELDDETIWGATAHMLATLLGLVAGRATAS